MSQTENWPVNGLPATLAGKTRRVYDLLAPVYPLSTMLFHSAAHRSLIGAAGIADGMRVLEVATGSGEMFRRLIRMNPNGATVGVDLSPNMAAKAQSDARRKFPGASAHCQAVDARCMPFRDGSFDAVVCCYLFELLAAADIVQTVGEIRRVLRRNGRLALVMIGQNDPGFNQLYKFLGGLLPQFWGRQVERSLSSVLEANALRIERELLVTQTFYPSRVVVARK